MGKLIEHVVQTRLDKYMEDRSSCPDTMFGFRSRLSACDVMLQLKEKVLDKDSRDTKVILGLDVAKAFDNVRHVSILENLSSLHVGKNVYDYVRDFLTDRKANLKMGEESIENIKQGNIGTPQGSVLSPTLFNVAMIGLPEKLRAIEGIYHSIYADDLTLWACNGSDGQIEESLQAAVGIIEEYLKPKGLRGSTEKSEVLLLRPSGKRSYARNEKANIHLQVYGEEVPAVDKILVLGLIIQANGKNSDMIL